MLSKKRKSRTPFSCTALSTNILLLMQCYMLMYGVLCLGQENIVGDCCARGGSRWFPLLAQHPTPQCVCHCMSRKILLEIAVQEKGVDDSLPQDNMLYINQCDLWDGKILIEMHVQVSSCGNMSALNTITYPPFNNFCSRSSHPKNCHISLQWRSGRLLDNI